MTLEELKNKLNIVSRSNEKEIVPETAKEIAIALMTEFISQFDSSFSAHWNGLSFNKTEEQSMTNETATEIKGDDVDREHLHNILDAWLDGEIIQVKNIRTENWVKEIDDFSLLITLDSYYRIKPKHTPLPIPDELWKLINPKFEYAAINENGLIYLYSSKPLLREDIECWVVPEQHLNRDILSSSAFGINTDGIDWRLSLTKRPEDL